jgi:hypothetical protein
MVSRPNERSEWPPVQPSCLHSCALAPAPLTANVDMANTLRHQMNETPPTEIPVTLLAQTLLDLKAARGNWETTRQAAILYFKAGIAAGFQVGPLLQWLCFWPSQRESVFGQAGYSPAEGLKFLDILKNISSEDIGLNDTTTC